MSLPKPEPGLVIAYSYLWRREAERGQESGAKDRPAVIVLVAGDRPDVMVVPITSQPVKSDRDVVAIPDAVARHLGLDDSKPSHVMVDEVNMFHWPNDLARVPGRTPGTFHYGFIPPKLFARIRDAVLRNKRCGELSRVKRDQA